MVAKTAKKGRCQGKGKNGNGCRKQAKQGRFCWSCLKSRYAEANPIKYAYQTLRLNAKRRGKVFELTLEQFTEFAIETDYINKRGRSRSSYHIDRIDETRGYSADNIQPLTNEENIKKSWKARRLIQGNYNFDTGEMEFHTSTEVIKPLAEIDEECGF